MGLVSLEVTMEPVSSLWFQPYEDARKSWQSATQRLSPEPDHVGTMILDFQPQKL